MNGVTNIPSQCEYKRHFFRTYDKYDQWWLGMLGTMRRDSPIELARLQFKCAMTLAQEKEKRRESPCR